MVFFYTDVNYLSPAQKFLIMLQVLIMTVLIPVMFFLLLKTLKKIDTIMAENASQRKLPLLFQSLLLAMLLIQSLPHDYVPELFYFFLGAIITSLVAMAVAFLVLKPSLHMAAMSAMLAFVIGLSIHNQQNMIALISVLFGITGVTASSRLQMEAHTNSELFFGLLIGAVPQLALWQFWL